MSEPRAILRPDDKGRPDDIVIDCTAIHLERMNKGAWYLGVWRGDKVVKFWLQAKNGNRIEVTPYDDELGLEDDSDQTDAQIAAMLAAANG